MIAAMKIMGEKGFKRAAMVKNGQLIGMLTEEPTKKVMNAKPSAP
jgi:CBS domain-containing protein